MMTSSSRSSSSRSLSLSSCVSGVATEGARSTGFIAESVETSKGVNTPGAEAEMQALSPEKEDTQATTIIAKTTSASESHLTLSESLFVGSNVSTHASTRALPLAPVTTEILPTVSPAVLSLSAGANVRTATETNVRTATETNVRVVNVKQVPGSTGQHNILVADYPAPNSSSAQKEAHPSSPSLLATHMYPLETGSLLPLSQLASLAMPVNLTQAKTPTLASIASPPESASVLPSTTGSQNLDTQMIANAKRATSSVEEQHTILQSSRLYLQAKLPQGRPRSNSLPISPSSSVLLAETANAPHLHVTSPSLSGQSTPTNKLGHLRRGKWTVEEETYVARVIQDFNTGYLNAPAGTTLRTFLSDKLNCDPMRITKKFTGDACIGKRVFHPAVRCANNAASIDKAQAELETLERRWRRRLEMQQRESAKKAAASAAAATAGRHHLPSHGIHVQPGVVPNPQQSMPSPSSQKIQQSVVAQTASWLDRANAILSSNAAASSQWHQEHQQGQSIHHHDVEHQMKEVQRLIYEGPIIQQSSAGLPSLLEKKSTANNSESMAAASSSKDSFGNDGLTKSSMPYASHSAIDTAPKRKMPDDKAGSASVRSGPNDTAVDIHYLQGQHFSNITLPLSPATSGLSHDPYHLTGAQLETAGRYPMLEDALHFQQKRPRKSFSTNHLPSLTSLSSLHSAKRAPSSPGTSTTGAEDAATLIGFLSSVRASAATDLGSGPSNHGVT